MQVGAGRDRGNEVASRYAAEFLRYCEGDGYGCDADMAAGADIVVVEHMAEAAIDECRPRRWRLEPEAEYGAFRTSAQRLDVLGNDAGLRREPAGADRYAHRIQHDLFDQIDELPRQCIKRE